MANSNLLFIGIRGSVLALDRATGQTVWATKLKGGDFVNLVLDGGDLYATARGEVSCLDPATGNIRWTNPLKGYGLGLAAIASPGGSQAVLLRSKRREEEQEAAAT
jgi:outer membrane protein assembly factor BamB